MNELPAQPGTRAVPTGNRFDRMEWAGTFGDLGTLIPFVAAYISVLKLDPFGVLFAFGACMLVCGLYYKTPFPVQPMKAIGAVAAIQGGARDHAWSGLRCFRLWPIISSSSTSRTRIGSPEIHLPSAEELTPGHFFSRKVAVTLGSLREESSLLADI